MPGLAAEFGGYSPSALPPAPALSRWLAQGARETFTASWCEPAIADLCGVDAGPGGGVATLTYQQDFSTPAPRSCLRAYPVHLRADSGGLQLFDSSAFALTDQEGEALTATLNDHLAADQYRIVCGAAKRWYLLSDQLPRLDTTALPQARARRLPAMPYGGGDAGIWTRSINEIQMLLHNHPVNRQRAQQGQPAVNSLWLWGGGAPAAALSCACDQLLSDSAYARGLARHAGVTHADLPAGVEALLSDPAAGRRRLIVLEACRDAAAYQQIDAWMSAMGRLERDWFAPLVEALRRRRVDTLHLYPLNGYRYRLTRARLPAFWKGRGDYRRERAFRCAQASHV